MFQDVTYRLLSKRTINRTENMDSDNGLVLPSLNADSGMDGRQNEADGEEEEQVAEHEEQAGTLQEQERPPDAGANGRGMRASAHPVNPDGAQGIGRPPVASSTTEREQVSWPNFVESTPEWMLHDGVAMLRQMPD